jgi:hypothetical protein
LFVGKVNNLAKEVTHLKHDNALLKQEIHNLQSVIEVSPRLHPKYIPKEQRILPAEVSRKDASYVEHVPTVALSIEALPAAPISAATILIELSYRDVATVGISPLGSAPLPDRYGFKTVTYRKKAATNTPPAEIPATRKVIHRKEPCIGVSSSLSPVIRKPERTKALFVSRFSLKVTDDISKALKEQLSLKILVCTKLRTKFNSYSSFHRSVTEDEFSLTNNAAVWSSDCLIAP